MPPPFGLGLVIAAGTSTALGAGAVFQGRIVKIASKPVLAAGLGFSGGVMLYVWFIEFFVKAQLPFAADRSEGDAYLHATLAFFAGVAVLRLITALVHMINRNHVHDVGVDRSSEDQLPSLAADLEHLAAQQW